MTTDSAAEAVFGPVDTAVIHFAGNQFNGEIGALLFDLVNRGVIRLLDLLAVIKDEDGGVVALTLGGMEADIRDAFAEIEVALDGDLIDDEDAAEVAAALAPGNSALFLCWENTWAAELATAMRRANGELVEFGRVPADALLEMIEAIEEIEEG